MLLLNVGAVCSEKETENDLLESHWGDAIDNAFVIAWWGVRQSDLLATVPFFTWSKLYNREEETKNWRENTDVNERTIALDEIQISWGL